MAKIRDKKTSQLRGFNSVYCPEHGHSKVPVLSPLVCPGCEMERGHSDLLRRRRRKERHWKYKQYEYGRGMEEDGTPSF